MRWKTWADSRSLGILPGLPEDFRISSKTDVKPWSQKHLFHLCSFTIIHPPSYVLHKEEFLTSLGHNTSFSLLLLLVFLPTLPLQNSSFSFDFRAISPLLVRSHAQLLMTAYFPKPLSVLQHPFSVYLVKDYLCLSISFLREGFLGSTVKHTSTQFVPS